MSSLEQALKALACTLPAAEVHGLASGLLSATSSSRAKSLWFRELLESAGLDSDAVAAHADSLRWLDTWFGEVLETLNSTDLAYDPLMPDDSASVDERLRALGDFCAGFTYGVTLAGAELGNRPLPADTREILEDFQAIDSAGSDGGEQDEASLVELVEYVRVGVLVVLEELRPIDRVVQQTEQMHRPS